jgi:dihydrolipoamide dehydrogenase
MWRNRKNYFWQDNPYAGELMEREAYDLIVVGAGPGGYVAAIRAALLGMKVAVVEKREALGGVCLNEGCIPSKALLDSSEHFVFARDKLAGHGIKFGQLELDLETMMKHKNDVVRKLTDGIGFLFKKHKITSIPGIAQLLGPEGEGHRVKVIPAEERKLNQEPNEQQIIHGKRVLLATGSEAAPIPSISFDGELVVSAKEALSFDRVPQHLLVIGAGFIGLELGSIWRRLGSEVTVVEMLPKPLPGADGQAADTIVKALKKQGLGFRLEASVTGIEKHDGKAFVGVSKGEKIERIECDRVLVAVGRRPLMAGLGLENFNIKMVEGRIAVDRNYQTSIDGIYAIGDLIKGPMLAHKAMAEGEAFAERLDGQASVVDYELIPAVAYTWPEVAYVGKTEEQLKREGAEYAVGRFPFTANGRAKCLDAAEGFAKILARPNGGRVLGVHIVGPRASDLIAEAVAVMTYGGSAQDIGMMLHAHPTLSETMKEAALDVERRAIHI